MARTGRYCFNPMAGKRLTIRRTLGDRFRSWLHMRRRETPDVFRVTWY